VPEELFTVDDAAQVPASDATSDTPTGEFEPTQFAAVEPTPEVLKAEAYPLPQEPSSAAAVAYPLPDQVSPVEAYEPPAASLPPAEPVVQPAAQGYPLPPAQQAYTPPYSPPYAAGPRPPKDRALAIIAEALPGLFGFLGIGWLYAGNTTAGIIILLGFLFWNFIAAILDFFTVGLFLCLHLPANLVAVLVSSFLLYNSTKKMPELFGR
jgi:hypothetical protein